MFATNTSARAHIEDNLQQRLVLHAQIPDTRVRADDVAALLLAKLLQAALLHLVDALVDTEHRALVVLRQRRSRVLEAVVG